VFGVDHGNLAAINARVAQSADLANANPANPVPLAKRRSVQRAPPTMPMVW
jgi:hypothetical protein